MAAVNVLAVRVLNNPALYTDPLAFEIEYEALSSLQEDLVWKLTYVGCADNDQHDQELENVAVGPVEAGSFKFVLEANPPNPALIPADDIAGLTIIVLTCSYRNQEFIRVGYYVINEYTDEELKENPPEQPQVDRLQRCLLVDHPRVTRYPIPFDNPEPQGDGMDDGNMDDGMGMMDAPMDGAGAMEEGQGSAGMPLGGMEGMGMQQQPAYHNPGGDFHHMHAPQQLVQYMAA